MLFGKVINSIIEIINKVKLYIDFLARKNLECVSNGSLAAVKIIKIILNN